MCIQPEGPFLTGILPGSLLQKATPAVLHDEGKAHPLAPSSFAEELIFA